MSARFLVDRSALAQMTEPMVQKKLGAIIERGEAATCSIIDLEVLFSAKDRIYYERILQRRRLAYDLVPLSQPVFDRAIEVQTNLARRGRHQRLPIQDLVVAAAAESAGLTVLHYDRGFDLIRTYTKQPMEWVAAPDSL